MVDHVTTVSWHCLQAMSRESIDATQLLKLDSSPLPDYNVRQPVDRLEYFSFCAIVSKTDLDITE